MFEGKGLLSDNNAHHVAYCALVEPKGVITQLTLAAKKMHHQSNSSDNAVCGSRQQRVGGEHIRADSSPWKIKLGEDLPSTRAIAMAVAAR
jgi:hypothetical protein